METGLIIFLGNKVEGDFGFSPGKNPLGSGQKENVNSPGSWNKPVYGGVNINRTNKNMGQSGCPENSIPATVSWFEFSRTLVTLEAPCSIQIREY